MITPVSSNQSKESLRRKIHYEQTVKQLILLKKLFFANKRKKNTFCLKSCQNVKHVKILFAYLTFGLITITIKEEKLRKWINVVPYLPNEITKLVFAYVSSMALTKIIKSKYKNFKEI